jgi:hypothetical protein
MFKSTVPVEPYFYVGCKVGSLLTFVRLVKVRELTDGLVRRDNSSERKRSSKNGW